jgi:DNA-directed RNA polymerase subunit RPC12/RpoP
MRKTELLASFGKINGKLELLPEKGLKLVVKIDAQLTEGTDVAEAAEDTESTGSTEDIVHLLQTILGKSGTRCSHCIHRTLSVHRYTGLKAVAAAGKTRKTFNTSMTTINFVNVRDEIDFH